MSSSSSSSLPSSIKCQRVSLKEIEDATENFDERYALGQGGEARIYLARIMLGRSEISTQVAVKHLKPNSFGFEDEIQIMSKIQHPNIVSLLGYCSDSGQKILIYEYMPNGSLADYVQKKQKPPTANTSTISFMSWQQRLKICLGAALGLKHLHAETKEFAKGIIHRDVKPDNILLDANWVAKISDFGMFKLSRADQIDSAMPTMLKGTGGYYAPEYLKYQHVTRKIDVYAFGVVLFQVLCRKMPWDRGDESYYGMEEDEDLGDWARQNVDSKIRGEISDYCLNAFTEIIRKSLSVNPKKRPKMNEVVLNLRNVLKYCQEPEDEPKILEAKVGKHDNMGLNVVPVKELTAEETNIMTLELLKNMDPNDVQNEKSQGQLEVDLVYNPFKDNEVPADAEDANAVQKAPEGTPETGGLLVVIIHEAKDLEGKHHTNPSAYLLFRGEEKRTKRVMKNRDPRWEEEFHFMLEDPPTDDILHLEVVSTSNWNGLLFPKERLGYVALYLSDVVTKKRINEKYHLIDSENGQILVELQWRTS